MSKILPVFFSFVLQKDRWPVSWDHGTRMANRRDISESGRPFVVKSIPNGGDLASPSFKVNTITHRCQRSVQTARRGSFRAVPPGDKRRSLLKSIVVKLRIKSWQRDRGKKVVDVFQQRNSMVSQFLQTPALAGSKRPFTPSPTRRRVGGNHLDAPLLCGPSELGPWTRSPFPPASGVIQ